MSYCRQLAILNALAAVFVGCGAKDTRINGSVTYNGQPVERGAISFKPADGKGQSFGAQIVDGKYTATKASPGKKTAIVVGVKKMNFALSSEEATRKADEAQAAKKSWAGHLAEPADYIPENADGNSKAVDINPGDQTVNFEIKGPPRQ
jgi:hypothetical protein